MQFFRSESGVSATIARKLLPKAAFITAVSQFGEQSEEFATERATQIPQREPRPSAAVPRIGSHTNLAQQDLSSSQAAQREEAGPARCSPPQFHQLNT